jgi:RNA polymerase sigma-70 factor (ECF subfamily)
VEKIGAAFDRYDSCSDEELVRLVRADKPEVFAYLYQRYYSRVYRLAYGMLGRHEAADDLTQEVFLRAYQKLESFKGESSFATWFYRLAANCCLNFSEKRRKKDQRESEEITATVPFNSDNSMETNLLQREAQEQIQRALSSLKPKFRLLVLLKDIEGLSYDEIAERLNCSTGTLASQLKRARHLLARKLEHLRGAF